MARAASDRRRHGHHRQHILTGPMQPRRAARRAAGRGKHPACQRQADAAHAEERVCSRRRACSPGTGLSPPASSVRMVTGLPSAHSSDPAIGSVLASPRRAANCSNKELGADQADAVADGPGRVPTGRQAIGDIDHDLDRRAVQRSRPVRRDARLRRTRGCQDWPRPRAPCTTRRSLPSGMTVSAPASPSSNAFRPVGLRQGRPSRPPSGRRASAPAWRHGSTGCPGEGDAAAADQSTARNCGRRQILAGNDDRAGRDARPSRAGKARAARGRGCRARSARAGAEILVVGRLIAGNLVVDSVAVQASCGRSPAAMRRRRARQARRPRASRPGIRGCRLHRPRLPGDKGGEIARGAGNARQPAQRPRLAGSPLVRSSARTGCASRSAGRRHSRARPAMPR